jgi:hypothetical protein
MKDSLQKISQETQLILLEEQFVRFQMDGKKPAFKQLIADAVQEQYNSPPSVKEENR